MNYKRLIEIEKEIESLEFIHRELKKEFAGIDKLACKIQLISFSGYIRAERKFDSGERFIPLIVEDVKKLKKEKFNILHPWWSRFFFKIKKIICGKNKREGGIIQSER